VTEETKDTDFFHLAISSVSNKNLLFSFSFINVLFEE